VHAHATIRAVPMQGELPVYVVHWNAPEWAASTCESFLASTIPIHVTVIDNGPYTRALVLDERVRVVRSGGNLGYAGGANLAVADWLSGAEEFCVVACHDVRLNASALQKIVAAAQQHPDYGVLAPTPRENVAGGPILARGADVSDVAWASGTCLLLRRSCVEQIGGFDADFGSYGEDIDLCLRARAAGWKIGIVDAAHADGAGSVEPRFRTQMYVNQVRLRAKHAGLLAATKMVLALPALAALDAVRWVFRRDETLLLRSQSRIRAIPRATRLVWERARAARAAR
jgi:N-acetylglucosaminyl-diphospho-decaprenol L-rhamnosyltransferase